MPTSRKYRSGGKVVYVSKGENATSMGPAQFDRYVRENGTEVIYRGYSAASQNELEQRTNELLTGTHRESGENASASGRGLYFADNEIEASGYVTRRQQEQGHQYGNVAIATLRKDTKIADPNTLNSLYQQKDAEASDLMNKAFSPGISRADGKKLGEQSDSIRNMDIGTYAKSKGYDAIKTALGETVVLNQKKVIYRR